MNHSIDHAVCGLGRVARRSAVVLVSIIGVIGLGISACEPESDAPSARAAADSAAPGLRLISLAPSLSRVVLALGRADCLVGVDRYSAELPELASVASLGGLFAPDLERTLALQPELVLGVEGTQQSVFFDLLAERGIRVERFRLHSLDQVLAGFERVGDLIGRAEAGRALARHVREELAAIAAPTRDLERPRVALVVEQTPLYVVGGGSFASALLETAGARNVFGDLPAAYPRVSLEALAGAEPDLVIAATAPDRVAEARTRAYWEGFQFVPRVAVLPRGNVVLPGPDLPRAARVLRALVHPDLQASERP